ncbi:MAG: 2-dehydropantoate 2-reductase [Herpetosiphonaceae bacterium]|nr:2-dehydropantoate 2-reductase [Herpetosiphonaceae bacterium]
MKIAVIGGAGAMGSIFGGLLAQANNDVTVIDVAANAVAVINQEGLRIDEPSGQSQVVRLPATSDPTQVGPVDLVVVFVKCYHTASALQNVAPLLGAHTAVLSLQNGWGNAPRIAEIVGQERVLVGVTYHSGTLLKPGYVLHAGRGQTYIGELSGQMSDRLHHIAETFIQAGLDVTPTETVLRQIWSKLALNVCTLPTSALLGWFAGQLGEHDGTRQLMRGLLDEVIAVANAQGIELDPHERWESITGVLQRAMGAKSSMLQDVEQHRRTEIDVINGAIVSAGQRLKIATPYNQAMVWLVKALEETF